MIRVLTILAAIVALAVSAAPASAGLLSSPLGVSASANGYVANHTEGTVSVILGKVLTGKAEIIDGRHQVASGLTIRQRGS
jgi:p-aminobenzoyl-glutamate transporter AbgT